MWAPHAVCRACDTQLDAIGWEASLNDPALDVGRELAGEVGGAQVAGDGLKHMSTYGSEWAGRKYRTLLHFVVNWIASGNAADNSNALDSSEINLGSGSGRWSLTVNVTGTAAVSSSGRHVREVTMMTKRWRSAPCGENPKEGNVVVQSSSWIKGGSVK